MRDSYNQFNQKGVTVAAIGMGWPAAAAAFKDDRKIPFPLLVDHRKETYRAMDIRRGSAWEVLGPPMWIRHLQAYMRQGFSLAKQDWHQLAGVVIADRGGHIVFSHKALDPADNPPVTKLLAAVPG